ncbi:O-methyltransferase [Winogradskyella bathintestinalis]|uniref:Class I SAM-dependent methyltransferase n=1 Tax=Winogradskyella bathintestinalis TaxID=3035208 RepID=A0ABT7ZTX3_9FLAO|nr:class I SAM-dependent methyltransferase [Winogradskyella bathintestinalis]MDN3492450.1 class I SAM-dependent methyltransferase [Winogradskyella bathintestinalis]
MYQIISYIKFLIRSTNQHGVHSPFVYNFVTKCLYDKSKLDEDQKLDQYRTNLLNSDTILNVEDLGEGSKIFDTKQRNVSQMAKTSSSSKTNSKLLYRIAKYFDFKNTLELGTSLGMGTYALALANSEAKITTIEGCSITSTFAKSKLDNMQITNVQFLISNFSEAIPKLKEDSFDFIFFDGHHNKEATIKYFETLLPKTHNETVFVFDDIYWSKGMTEAWEYIKSHNAVTVSIDCFYLGLVFFRKEQVKEHFTIRV